MANWQIQMWLVGTSAFSIITPNFIMTLATAHLSITSENWNDVFQKKHQKDNWKDPTNLKSQLLFFTNRHAIYKSSLTNLALTPEHICYVPLLECFELSVPLFPLHNYYLLLFVWVSRLKTHHRGVLWNRKTFLQCHDHVRKSKNIFSCPFCWCY